MEIKKSRNRFLSILFIVAMGVAMFAGIQASAPDMRYTGDLLFDESNLMDVRVVGTMGLTWEDIEALSQLEGVQTVEAGYMTDVLCGTGERQTVLHIESLLETINQVTIKEGELPTKSGECFLDEDYMQKWGYQVGDTITVIPDDEKETEDESGSDGEDASLLRTTTFKIVGSGGSSAYLSRNRGSSSLGNGEVSGFMYILPEDFDSDVYLVAYMTAAGARDKVAYTGEYERLVEQVLESAEGIQDVRCEIRYREVRKEAQDTIDGHQADLESGESELEDAKKELEDGRKEAESELAKAKADLESGESELEDGKQQISEKEQELADAKQQIADGEAELADKEAQLADAKQQLAAGETQLSFAEKQLKKKQKEYDSQAVTAESELNAGQQQIDAARKELEAGRARLESEGQSLEEAALQSSEAAETLASSQAEYDAGAAALAEGETSYASGKAALDAAWSEYSASEETYHQQKAVYDSAAASLEQLKGQRDAAIGAAEQQKANAAELECQNSTLEGEIDGLNNEITALNSSISGWESENAALSENIAAWQAELERLEAAQNSQAAGNDSGDDDGGADYSEQIAKLKEQIAAAQNQISANDSSIASAQSGIAEKNSAIEAKRAQIDGNTSAISAANTAAAEQAAAAAALEPLIAQAEGELEAFKPALEAGKAQLDAAKSELDARTAALEEARAQLDTQTAALAEAKTQLDAGLAQLAAGQEKISAGKAQLESGKQELAAGEQELDASQEKIDSGKAQLASGKAQLNAAWKEFNSSKSKLNSSRSQMADGESQLAQGKQTLADSKAQVADGEQQIADARTEIEENEQKIKDGWKEYEEGKAEAESEILDGEGKIREAESELADAREKLADAQKEIDELEEPKWYVHDRAIYTDYSGLGENAERMVNIGKVFPALFFLVAALISLTTMTRMVEEQRTQIGTLKALGYSKASIAGKYMKYALFATLGGSILGFLVGQKILPYIIVWAYGMMYPNLRSPVIPYNWELGLTATLAALVCTLGATVASCYRELAATPAVLMRPPTPKEGKRVLLERIPFLWKRLNFSWKSTVRNLLRYKKRFFMTIIGIGGCMGLILVGFGLNDSILGIGVLQYEQLQTYDLMAILDSSGEEQEKLVSYIQEQVGAENEKKIYMQKISATDGRKEYNPYLYVPEDTENLEQFLVLRDRVSHESYELTDQGAIITEKLASMMNLQVGDEVLIDDEERGRIAIPVSHIVENYLYHYIYLTPAVYQQYFGESVEYNTIIVKSPSGEQEEVQRLGESILNREGVLNITYTYSIAGQLEDMLGSLDVVIAVLIICAGMLAFVVLYNLNNININERKRELATLKVLGFYDSEVALYVYRENILLTFIGAAVGIVMGIFLHRYIITTVEVDACMFGRNINFISFVYGTLFTVGFSLIVNGAMYFKLKKIDMVESLKSVE